MVGCAMGKKNWLSVDHLRPCQPTRSGLVVWSMARGAQPPPASLAPHRPALLRHGVAAAAGGDGWWLVAGGWRRCG